MLYNEKETLQIYCDASTTELNGVTYGCSGAIAVQNTDNGGVILQEVYVVLEYSTNNQSEIYAILLGISIAIQRRYEFNKVRIISDSLISIEGLRSWIYSWIKNAKNGILLSSSGSPVANQQIFLYSFYSILNCLQHCSLCHIDGHLSTTESSIQQAMKKYRIVNKVDINRDMMYQHIRYNNYVDTVSRYRLDPDEIAKQQIFNLNKVALTTSIPTAQELELYNKIIVTF